MTPLAYVDLIEKRFANPEIGDTTRRVAFDGSARHPGFIHRFCDAIAQNMPLDGLALGEALWARMRRLARRWYNDYPTILLGRTWLRTL